MVQTSASFRKDDRDKDSSISLSEVISALSFALDLTEGAVWGHALRSCLLGMRIADEIRLPEEKRSSLYFALLLKDVGWSSNATRMCEIDRIARIIRNGVTQHANNEEIIGLRCDRGA